MGMGIVRFRRCLAWLPVLCLPTALPAHDTVTTKLTWSKEISRLLATRCLGCHQTGGSAPFALSTYQEARPWAVAIRDEVASRRMPPWNAVRGFGRFAADPSLSQVEIQLVVDWVNGGAPEGDPRYLNPAPPNLGPQAQLPPGDPVPARDGLPLRPGTLTGLHARSLSALAPVRVLIQSPDGRMTPLAWLRQLSRHAPGFYAFAGPVTVDRGSILRVWGPPETQLELFYSPSPIRPAKPE